MPETNTLSIEPRDRLRKQNRGLRAGGKVPAVIYGHRVDPVSVSLPRREFQRAFHRVGKTQLLDLQIGGEDKSRKVLVREVQYNPRDGEMLHVDFYQVNLKEKIQAEVPIVVVGEAPAVQRREGELQHSLHTLKVSCLPADIPEHIEVDVSGMEALDDAIRLGQLTVPDGVEVLGDPEEVVVKVAHLRVAEAEPAAATEGEAAEGAAAEGTPAGEAGGEPAPEQG
jgi:large subunit ribosomal protein L25